MTYVDTNIFIRYLVGDDPAKAEACRELFRRLEQAHEVAVSTEATIAEVVYVLSSPRHYAQPRDLIASTLMHLLSFTGLQLENRRQCLRALTLFAEHRSLDFADAIAIAHFETQHLDGIYSYDRGLDRVPGVVRVEP